MAFRRSLKVAAVAAALSLLAPLGAQAVEHEEGSPSAAQRMKLRFLADYVAGPEASTEQVDAATSAVAEMRTIVGWGVLRQAAVMAEILDADMSDIVTAGDIGLGEWKQLMTTEQRSEYRAAMAQLRADRKAARAAFKELREEARGALERDEDNVTEDPDDVAPLDDEPAGDDGSGSVDEPAGDDEEPDKKKGKGKGHGKSKAKHRLGDDGDDD